MSRSSRAEQPTTADGAALHAYLLGSPVVEWSGTSLSISRRQVRALLYRLAADRHPLPREQLCYLFWPDAPESNARRKLTGLLSHLRHNLPSPEILVASNDRVWLDPSRTWSDAVNFARLRTAERPLPSVVSMRTHALSQAEQVAALQQAVDLYRGPFLAGFSLPECPEFEAWALQQCQAWERAYLEALATLIEARVVREESEAAIATAQRYLATDGLAEEVHRRLIELYAAVGDRGAAVRQYERCVAVLEQELGVGPLPETQAAYRSALDHRPPQKVTPITPLAWTTLPSLDVPLAGRREALRTLEQAFDRARSGRGGMVLIVGEPSIGKSRLMQDFAEHLSEHVLILVGAAYPGAQMTPYQPLVEAFRPALLNDRAAIELETWSLAEVARLIPELRTRYPDLPASPTIDPAQVRTALFGALCRLTLALASASHPAILCLDDLHWADSTTLDWLAHLGRQLGNSYLLVVGTHRSEETGPLAQLRRGLARAGTPFELALSGLNEAAVLQLLRHLTGPVPGDEALARRLSQATAGNPFFLLETLGALLEAERSLEHLADLKDLPLPETVREAVEARVARLSPRAQQVLEAGAVLDPALTLELLYQTAGRGEMETLDALDELAARQLLTEREAGYRFRHEVIRAAVYRTLSPWRRQVLHRRAGEALERWAPGDAATLAWHFGLGGAPGRAAHYALEAGQAAKAIFAHVEARAHADRALALLERDAANQSEPEAIATNSRLRVETLHLRGWALRLLGDMEVYARDVEELGRLAKLLGDPRTLAHLHWRQAYTHRCFCRYAEARVAAEGGVHLSQAAGDRSLEAMCFREVGLAARESGDYEEAQATLEQALAVYHEVGDVVFEIHALGNLATLHWYLGEHGQALELGRQALARCDEANLPLERRLPLGDMGAAAAAMGEADMARRCLLESLDIACQVADRTQQILCRLHLGWLSIRERQLAEALQHLQSGLTLAQQIGSCTEQGWLLSGLAEAHRLNQDRQRALDHARRALALAQATDRPYDERLAMRILERLDTG